MEIYPATWTVTGDGSLQRVNGPTTVSAQWTGTGTLQTVQIGFTQHLDRITVQRWTGHGPARSAFTGMQTSTTNGTVRSEVVLLDVQQWAFPVGETATTSTRITGSNTLPFDGARGPRAPGGVGALGTASCAWDYARGGSPSAPPPSSATTTPAVSGGTVSGGAPAGGAAGASGTGASGAGAGGAIASGSPGGTTAGGRAAGAGRAGAAPSTSMPGTAPNTTSSPATQRAAGVDSTSNTASSAGASAVVAGTPGGVILGTAKPCATVPAPQYSATPGGVTFALNRPPGTTSYWLSRRDLGNLTDAAITTPFFVHVAPLDYQTVYEYTILGGLSDGGCTTATASVRAPRPLTPQVTARVTPTGLASRVTLSWGRQADGPTTYLVLGAALAESGREVDATNAATFSVDIDNVPPGPQSWTVLPVWKTPLGNMSDVGARVTATIPAPPRPSTITLAGFTATGNTVIVGARTIPLAGFTATGTTVYVGPRTITLTGWTSSGQPATQGVVK